MNLIDVKNLLFNYKIYSGEKEEVIEHTAIDHVSLSIKKGDFVGDSAFATRTRRAHVRNWRGHG